MAFALKILLLLLLAAPVAQAQIKITSVSKASNYEIGDDGTSVTIWGGVAGDGSSCTSTSDLCDNCTAAASGAEAACNIARVNPNLEMTINFEVTGDIEGKIRFTENDNGTITHTTSTASDLKKGSTGSVTVQWLEFCTDAGSANCNSAGGNGNVLTGGNEHDFYIGISEDTTLEAGERATVKVFVHAPTATNSIDLLDCNSSGTASGNEVLAAGVCYFHAIPGDEKVYVDDLQATAQWPTNNSVPVEFLRIFISETSFDDADYGAAIYTDLEIDSDDLPDPNIISGLTNGQQYYFRPAVVDKAMNVAYLASMDEISQAGTGCGTGDDFTCELIATPLPVYGLLTEDLNCFISTVAFGSSMAKEVQTFREFRNRFMIDHKYGIAVRKAYYEHGPKFARWIHNHAWAKPIARASLYPALWYSQLSLKYGIQKANWIFSAFITLLLSMFFISFWGFRKWQSQKA